METKMKNLKLMESESIPKAILTLAIPTVLSSIISILYNITDTYFIGLLDDPIQLGAVSLAFPMFFIMQAIGNLFGLGAPSFISRCLGAGEYEEVKRTSCVSVYISASTTLVLTVLCLIFIEPILGLLGTSSDTIDPTRDYLRIILIFGVAVVMQSLLPSMLRAEGRVKEAVIGMVTGTVINIIFDPIFILFFDMGVSGAAWASIMGSVVADIYLLIVYVRGNTMLSIQPCDFKPSMRIFREVLKIGAPSSIANILGSFTMILFNNQAAAYGDKVVSAYGVALKLIQIEFMIIFGFVSGYTPFAGYNYGAGNIKRMTEALKFVISVGTVLCFVFLIPFTVLAPGYIGLFSSDSEVISIGTDFLWAQAWAVPIMAVQSSMTATFQATGQGTRSLIVSMGRQCLFYIPFLFLFNHLWGLNGLLHVQMASDLATTATGVLLAIPLLKKLLRQQKEKETAL